MKEGQKTALLLGGTALLGGIFIALDKFKKPPAPPPPPPPPPDFANLFGLVYNKAGAPLAGATVKVLDYITSTDEHGHYYLYDLVPGSYEVRVELMYYETIFQTVDLVIGNNHIDFQMASNIDLEGTVRDRDTDEPLAGVKVTVGPWATLTDNLGHYLFTDLEPGLAPYMFELANYEPLEGEIAIGTSIKVLNARMQRISVTGNLVGASASYTSEATYVGSKIGWRYLIDKIFVSWKNTGTGPIGARFEAVFAPLGPNGDYYCGAIPLAALSGNDEVILPGETGIFVFLAPRSYQGIITGTLRADDGSILQQIDWDPELQDGLIVGAKAAPGGAVTPEDYYVCPL